MVTARTLHSAPTPGSMTRTRVRHAIALILFVILLASACGGSVPSPQPGSSPQCTERARLQHREAVGAPAVAAGPTVALIIGDSYAQGAYLERSRVDAWPRSLGQLRGWTTYVDGIGGTGFTAPGPCRDQQFEKRASEAYRVGASVVVIEGGLNDTTAPPPAVEQASVRLLQSLRRVPTVIVVGPASTPARPVSEELEAALRGSTLSQGRLFVPARDWRLELQPDRLHPTVEGHRQFAVQLDRNLPANL